jgi:[protein-PII] uridylyltransferase
LIQKEILSFKKELALNELNLIKIFLKKRDGLSYLQNHSQLIDKTLSQVWQDLQFGNTASLIACGGYGRQELFPYSDVDLLILIPKGRNKHLSQKIEQFISLIWDLGLRIGHSVRSINETKIEVKRDITVQTNLLESRYLNGNKVLYKNLQKIINDTSKI